MKWARSAGCFFILAGLLTGCSNFRLNPYSLNTSIAPLPFKGPISYDDFTYNVQLNRVIIPAGETGEVALVDPTNMNFQIVSGFSSQTVPSAPVVGSTSVAIANGFLFGLDQNTISIKTVDLNAGNIVSSTPLKDAPDYIRFISATNELWVTEKASSQIEVFSISEDNPPVLESTDVIPVPNGPEALIVDNADGLAFTNRPKQGVTDVIQVMTHTVIGEWGNGCSQARGMAVDEADGLLFVVCREGKLVVMDIKNDGFQVTSQNYGASLDFVAYNPNLHHVYLPSSASGIVAIFQLQENITTPQPSITDTPGATPTAYPTTPPGETPVPNIRFSLSLLGTADTAVKSKCVTTDKYNNIWLCDPTNGQVFVVHDTFPDKSNLR